MKCETCGKGAQFVLSSRGQGRTDALLLCSSCEGKLPRNKHGYLEDWWVDPLPDEDLERIADARQETVSRWKRRHNAILRELMETSHGQDPPTR
jgi:hypothetical protein